MLKNTNKIEKSYMKIGLSLRRMMMILKLSVLDVGSLCTALLLVANKTVKRLQKII